MKWTNYQDLQKLRNLSKKKRNKPVKKKKKLKEKKVIPKLTYKQYLRSSRWESKRKQVFKRATYKCELCKINRATQVHHKTYKHIFNERLNELVAICSTCHRAEHDLLTEQEIEKAVYDLVIKDGVSLNSIIK